MSSLFKFVDDRRAQLLFNAWQHVYLVVLAIILATIIAVALAVVVTRVPALEPVANAVTAIGLTIPSFALIGLLLPITKLGATTALTCVTFYAVLPILRNSVVGLQGVNENLLESAKGMGMSDPATLIRIRIPLAWPVILAGVRVSAQMSMGIAAIAAYVLGPGLGVGIFTGLSQGNGSKNGLNYALAGTIGVIIVALLLDLLLVLLGRLTVSKGIRI